MTGRGLIQAHHWLIHRARRHRKRQANKAIAQLFRQQFLPSDALRPRNNPQLCRITTSKACTQPRLRDNCLRALVGWRDAAGTRAALWAELRLVPPRHAQSACLGTLRHAAPLSSFRSESCSLCCPLTASAELCGRSALVCNLNLAISAISWKSPGKHH